MIARPLHMLVRTASALAVVLALAGCTQGGQFDPTEVLAADPFGTKKKLQGEREPLFPSGVPGAECGVPHDLVKGYQPPPEQTAEESRRHHQTGGRGGRGKAETKTETQAKGRARTRGSTGGAGPRLGPEFGGSAAAAARPGLGSEIWRLRSSRPGRLRSPAAPAQQTAQPAQSIWPNPQAPNTSSR